MQPAITCSRCRAHAGTSYSSSPACAGNTLAQVDRLLGIPPSSPSSVYCTVQYCTPHYRRRSPITIGMFASSQGSSHDSRSADPCPSSARCDRLPDFPSLHGVQPHGGLVSARRLPREGVSWPVTDLICISTADVSLPRLLCRSRSSHDTATVQRGRAPRRPSSFAPKATGARLHKILPLVLAPLFEIIASTQWVCASW